MQKLGPTKSPSILYSSINFKSIFADKLSLIFLSKILFFLPPPQIRTCLIFSLKFFRDIVNSSPIIAAVKSVRVAAPSAKFKPLTKDISKSLVSNDNFLLSLLI